MLCWECRIEEQGKNIHLQNPSHVLGMDCTSQFLFHLHSFYKVGNWANWNSKILIFQRSQSSDVSQSLFSNKIYAFHTSPYFLYLSCLEKFGQSFTDLKEMNFSHGLNGHNIADRMIMRLTLQIYIYCLFKGHLFI